MGQRDLNKEPLPRPHGSQRRPNGADKRRKDSLDDRGMKDFVDSLEGMNTGARNHSIRVSPEDRKGKAKRVDSFREEREVQDKKYPAKEDKGGGHHGEHRQKKHAHDGKYADEDRKHKDRGHQERSPRDHRHKEPQHRDDRQEKRPDRDHQHDKHPDRDHRPKEHPDRDHRHKEPHKRHPLTEKEFNKKMYELALLPFRENRGTPYKCEQREIDFHHRGVFSTPNAGPFVTRMQATQEILRWNDEKRAPPRDELELIRQLAIVVHDAEKNSLFHPDIVVKAFADLDRVFFCGRLRGNVAVQWVEGIEDLHDDEPDGRTYGETKSNRTGQCRIRLNATAILQQRWSKVGKNSVACMFGTLLHEMCHAYDFVRCPKRQGGVDGHDEKWQTMIGVIHDRCCRILGTVSLLFHHLL